MRWKKLGKIFDPRDHILPNGCQNFAQSPQALVFEDKIRVYFSTREKSNDAKFLSHVAFVDFSRDFKHIISVSRHEVLPLGELGTFDEHGIFPISPLAEAETLVAYTTGWTRRRSVSVDTGIGIVYSKDGGETFSRLNKGPVLSATLHEPFLVCDGFVRIFNNKYHMWYIFGTSWRTSDGSSEPDRTYKIGHAISTDGLNWVKNDGVAIVDDKLGKSECQALPSVIKLANKFHMFFAYRSTFGFRSGNEGSYKIGHAWSEDLVNWIRNDDEPKLVGGDGEWDSEMQCYPHVFAVDEKIFLLYNGNEFGKHGFGLAELVF